MSIEDGFKELRALVGAQLPEDSWVDITPPVLQEMKQRIDQMWSWFVATVEPGDKPADPPPT